MKKVSILLLGLVVFLTLAPFSHVAYAEDYPFFGPQTGSEDPYLYFGDEVYPKNVGNGLELTVDESSVSFQSIVGEMRIIPNDGTRNIIHERKITEFLILANGRIVDRFSPSWDQEKNKYRGYYRLRIAFDDWNIGSNIQFQVVAISHREPSVNDPGENNTYVVAWSSVMGPYQLKPQPVIDREAISVLEAILAKLKEILAKLEDLKNALLAKLDQINKSIREIYEIKPETQAKFDAAMNNLMDKLPTSQVEKEANKVKDMIDQSANKINNTQQDLKFGRINWMGVVTTDALDFSSIADQIALLRKIAQITLWCEFFYFVILILRPRLTV